MDVKEWLYRRSVPAHLLLLDIRRDTISLTALSTKAVEMGSPRRRRAP
jgi:hypothetical protein